MKFEYTGRHVEVSPAIRRHVEDHFKKLDHIFNEHNLSTHVIIDVEKNRQIGEMVVNWRDHTLTAKDTNADMYMALTRAMAKIEKQAVKLKKKIIDRKQSGKSSVASSAGTGWTPGRCATPAAHHSGAALCSQANDCGRSGDAALRGNGPVSRISRCRHQPPRSRLQTQRWKLRLNRTIVLC